MTLSVFSLCVFTVLAAGPVAVADSKPKTAERLLGKWEREADGRKWEFRKDGTVVATILGGLPLYVEPGKPGCKLSYTVVESNGDVIRLRLSMTEVAIDDSKREGKLIATGRFTKPDRFEVSYDKEPKALGVGPPFPEGKKRRGTTFMPCTSGISWASAWRSSSRSRTRTPDKKS